MPLRCRAPLPAPAGIRRFTSFPIEPADTRLYAWIGEISSGSSPQIFRAYGK